MISIVGKLHIGNFILRYNEFSLSWKSSRYIKTRDSIESYYNI